MFSTALESYAVPSSLTPSSPQSTPQTPYDAKRVEFPLQDSFSLGPVHRDLKPSELELILSRLSDTKVWHEQANGTTTHTMYIDQHGSVMSVQAPIDESSGGRYLRFTHMNRASVSDEDLRARVSYVIDELQKTFVMETNYRSRPPKKIIDVPTIFGSMRYLIESF